MNKYTLTLHKPDSDDYCRGCHMASYPGNFEFIYDISEEKLISTVADYMTVKLEYHEVGYSSYIHVYHNGHLSVINIEHHSGDLYFKDETDATGEDIQVLAELIEKIKIAYKEKKEFKEKEEARLKKEAELKKLEESKARELAEFNRLKKKFEEQDRWTV